MKKTKKLREDEALKAFETQHFMPNASSPQIRVMCVPCHQLNVATCSLYSMCHINMTT